MEIFNTDKYCIITPLSPKLSEHETARISSEIGRFYPLRIGLDLSYVRDCTIDFIEKIKELGNVSLFNVSSDIFAILISMNLDKSIKLYVSEMDFLDNRHQLLNRKFKLI